MKVSMTRAEWQVMRVLWAHPDSGSSRIIDYLSSTYDWQASTIKTLLGRLRKKELIETSGSRGKFTYRAKLSEADLLAQMGQEWLDNQCATKHGQHLLSLLEQAKLSQKDLGQLMEWASLQIETAPEHVQCSCLPGQCNC